MLFDSSCPCYVEVFPSCVVLVFFKDGEEEIVVDLNVSPANNITRDRTRAQIKRQHELSIRDGSDT